MKISIIIAAYNVEKFIERAIASVINQGFYQIIVVNDGSTDKTEEKILKYKNQIKIITQENKGLLLSRIEGAKQVNGDYLMFLDGDDWLDSNAYHLINENLKKDKEIDILLFGLKEVDAQNQIKIREIMKKQIEVNNNYLEMILTGEIRNNLVLNCIKKSFYDKLKFNKKIENISYGEDLFLTTMMALEIPKIKILDKYIYNYYQNSNSLTRKENDKVLDIIKVLKYIEKELENKKMLSTYKKELEYLIFNHLFYYRLNLIKQYKKDNSKKLYKEWLDQKINIFKNIYFYRQNFKYKIKVIMYLIYLNLKNDI